MIWEPVVGRLLRLMHSIAPRRPRKVTHNGVKRMYFCRIVEEPGMTASRYFLPWVPMHGSSRCGTTGIDPTEEHDWVEPCWKCPEQGSVEGMIFTCLETQIQIRRTRCATCMRDTLWGETCRTCGHLDELAFSMNSGVVLMDTCSVHPFIHLPPWI